MEDALDESINELFVQENIDPRIENAMPILSRLKKPTVEMAEVSSLAEWADDIINEKLELDEVLDTRDAKMSYAKKNMDSHQNAVSTYHKSTDPKEKKAADKTAMKRVRGMNTFVKNKISDDDLDESRGRGFLNQPTKRETDWFDVRKMSDAHMDKLNDLTLGREGPGQYLEYGENHGLPEYVVGIHSGLKNADRTYEHLMRYAKPFKSDITEGDSQYKVGDKVNWHDSKFDKNMSGTITVVSSGKRNGVKYASVKATGTHGSDFKVPHSKLKKVEEGLDANQKRAGQLGPTEKVKNNNIGKLVGANESAEIDPELARIIEMAKFKR
jgi:hypothetical protein